MHPIGPPPITTTSPEFNHIGDTQTLIDISAPFGGRDEVMKELREKVFEGQKIKTLKSASDDSGVAESRWRSSDVWD